MERVIAIAGPTAAGKSALAINLAKILQGEIISADSMQFYRGLNIGTAKIRPKETAGIPHHLIDIKNPDEPYSISDFQKDATALISSINQKGLLPLVTGGSGLYLNALLDGYSLNRIKGENHELRLKLHREADIYGSGHLHKRLLSVDSVTAARLHPNDTKRIIRALEVYTTTGVPLSQTVSLKPPAYLLAYLGITMERETLYDRINQRVEQMIKDGLINEVAGLLAQGYSPALKPLGGLGYKEIIRHLTGEISLEEAIRLIKRNTRHFAKRQMTWWRRDCRIIWLHREDYKDMNELTYASAQIIKEQLKIINK